MSRTPEAILLIAMISASSAAADTPDQLARQKFDDAMTLYDLGRYDDSIPVLEQGYKLSPRRKSLLKNLAMARRAAGELELRLDGGIAGRRHFAVAADLLRRYLEYRPDEPDREKLQEMIATLDLRSAQSVALPAPVQKEERREPVVDPRLSPAPLPTAGQNDAVSRQLNEVLEEVKERRRFYVRVGAPLAAGGGVTLLAGALLLWREGVVSGELKASSIDRRYSAEGEALSLQKDTFLIAGAVSVTLGLVSLGSGIALLAAPIKMRKISIVPAGAGVQIEGTF